MQVSTVHRQGGYSESVLFYSGFSLFSVMSTHYFNEKRIFFFFSGKMKKARVKEEKGKKEERKVEGRRVLRLLWS